MMIPREYQKRSVDAAINWMKKNTSGCVLDLSMSAGKSFIGALIAHELVNLSGGKKVLVLCPTATLVEQNAEKYADISDEYSIYSASISKSLRHNVVFATPLSFAGIVDKTNGEFCAVIVDEGDGITETIKDIIAVLREKNPLLRLCAMTGTPYRTGEGWIAEIDLDGSVLEEVTNPYYKKIVARVSPHELIDLGFATPPKVIPVSEKYDTSKLVLTSGGNFTQESLDEAFVGHGKKTSLVVADVVNHANAINARGVMLFAANIDHCNEIMASLPNYNSGVINGEMGDAHNKDIIKKFRNQEIKYLVNVNMATVGFSVDHVDIIAILRATSSSRLYQQILGRGMRLDSQKKEFLVLDYTDNIANLFPSGDVFSPEIVAYGKKPSTKIDVTCPECNHVNEFSLRPNPERKAYDSAGYFLDLSGERIMDNGKYFPAHYGRRCTFVQALGRDNFQRCNHFWEHKECKECGHKNDIAARKCESCKKLLIDHNDKITADFAAFKNDLTQIQTDKIIRMSKRFTKSKSGNDMFRVYFKTEYREFLAFFSKRVNKRFYEMLQDNTFKPETVSYKKKTDFWTVVDFNRKADAV